MHDGRAQSPQRAPQSPIHQRVVAGALVQLDHLHRRVPQACRERIGPGQAQDGVAEALRRAAIDDIHQAVFQTAGAQRVDDVNHQWRLVDALCPHSVSPVRCETCGSRPMVSTLSISARCRSRKACSCPRAAPGSGSSATGVAR